MPISKETKKTAYLIEGAVGIFAVLTGRWNLLLIDGIAVVLTAALPEKRSTNK